MTKEEAIFCEKSYIGETDCADCKYYGTDTCKSRESHKMAIEALEQQPCEDAVSREAIIGIIKELPNANPSYSHSCDVIDRADLIYVMERLESVQLQRKRGKWIKYGVPRCGEQHYKCSVCDDYINFGVYSDYYLKNFRYCPNCGADMRGDTDADERRNNSK